MTQEQKAKAYDEALEKFRPIYELAKQQGRNIDVEEFEDIFPELKESEDERMIKSLTRLVKAFYNCNFPTPEGFERKDILAYLEKQKEQKPAEWNKEDEKSYKRQQLKL